MATRPMLILLCGLPGAGKSTLAERLSSDRAAVRLSGDDWLIALGIDLHDEAIRERLETVLWRLAQDLLRLGQSVILESGFWARTDRDEKRVGARALGAAVALLVLDVPFEQRWERIEHRNATAEPASAVITRQQLASWERAFELPDAEERGLFDELD